MKNLFFILATLLYTTLAWANGGHSIRIKLTEFSEKEIYLAYYYGDKQYIRDTAVLDATGYFEFAGAEELPGGVYMIVMPPNNEYFQLLINASEQQFSLTTNARKPAENMRIEASPDNKLLYDYLNYLSAKRPEADTLRARIARASDESQKAALQKQLEAINESVQVHQRSLIAKYPKTLTAAIIRANMPLDEPEYQGADEMAIQEQRWRYTLEHFFDNVNLGDPRMLRTPFLFERVQYYVEKLNVQHPDSINQAIDFVLGKMRPAEETFKYYLIHFLNFYAKSQFVGMDAIYVHLVNRYYASGQAPWTEREQLEKIIENAKALEPLLIGKIAPDITLQRRDGSKINLHGVNADFTVVYFWKYDCGVCKKGTPVLKEFYEKYKDRGVEIFAVCYKFGKDVPECWDYVDENGINDWIHVADPYNSSRFSDAYFVKATPTIYLLDKKKEIVSKRIAAEQLDEILERVLEMKSKEK